MRPGCKVKTKRNPKAPPIDPKPHVATALRGWRRSVCIRDFPGAFFGPSSILPDEAVNIVASLPTITNKLIAAHLQNKWKYWDIYGEELSREVLSAIARIEEGESLCDQSVNDLSDILR